MPHTNDANGDAPERCERPDCPDDAVRTYHDANGNALELCQRHYYRLVSRQPTTGSLGTATDRPVTTSFDLGGDDLSTPPDVPTQPSPPAPRSPDPLRPPTPRDGGSADPGDDG